MVKKLITKLIAVMTDCASLVVETLMTFISVMTYQDRGAKTQLESMVGI